MNAAERPYPQPEAVVVWKMYMGLSSTNSLIFVKSGNHKADLWIYTEPVSRMLQCDLKKLFFHESTFQEG